MKSFFRRLSSKGQERGYRSPNSPRWPSFTASTRKALPAPVGSNNPAFLDQESQAAQQHFMGTVYQDYPQKLSNSNDAISVVASDNEPTTVARPASQVSNSTSAHTVKADSSLDPKTHARKDSDDSTTTAMVSNISQQHEPDFAPEEAEHDAPSIYKSYNDIDIMSTGNFDFDHSALLSTAPSADWFAGDRSAYRPRTAPQMSSSRPSQQWTSLPPTPLPAHHNQRRHAHQQNKAPSVSTSISQVSPASDTSVQTAPVAHDSPSPMAAVDGVASLPPGVTTPFAKYANKGMHEQLLAEDIDSAMQPSTQLKQHLSGQMSRGLSSRLHSRQLSGASRSSLDSIPRKSADSSRSQPHSHKAVPQLQNGLTNGAAQHSRQPSWASDAPARRLEPEFGHTAVPPTSLTFGQPTPTGPQENGWHPVTGRMHQNVRPANNDFVNGNTQLSQNAVNGSAGNGNSAASLKGSGWHIVNGAGQPATNGRPSLSLSRASSADQKTRQSSAQRQLSGKLSGKPADATPSHVEEAQKQVEQALQTADHQIEALRARVSKKSAQLSEARLQLGSLRQDMQDMGSGHKQAPPSLPDTDSTDQAEMAAAEMQLLHQALDKLQAETQMVDDELAQAREQAILGELERAELSHELENTTAKLQASESSRAELEGTISKLLHDVQGRSYRRHPRANRKSILNTDSFNTSDVTSPHSLDNDTDIMSSQSNIMRTNSHLLHTTSLPKDNGAHKEVAALESEIESLRHELKETKRQAQADVAKAKQEAIGVMQATGDADAEVKKLMGESAQATSSQQEAEAELMQSQQTIQDLQTALKNAQAVMTTDRLERQQALTTIADLKEQKAQLEASQLQLPQQDAVRLSQHISQLDRQVAELAESNDELSTDLGRALDVAQRVMEQKSALQQQVMSQEQQLLQWQAEGKRITELEGFADEALTALEAQTAENARLRQQVAASPAFDA